MKESELARLTSLRALEVQMARIPDDKLSRLKSEVSVARMVEGCGVAVVARGVDCRWGVTRSRVFSMTCARSESGR